MSLCFHGNHFLANNSLDMLLVFFSLKIQKTEKSNHRINYAQSVINYSLLITGLVIEISSFILACVFLLAFYQTKKSTLNNSLKKVTRF